MQETEFLIGQAVTWNKKGQQSVPSDWLGNGPFTVHLIDQVPEYLQGGVGHSQWVELSKKDKIKGGEVNLVFDKHVRQWCLPENLSYDGRVNSTRLSGYFLRPMKRWELAKIDFSSDHRGEAQNFEPLAPTPTQFLNAIIGNHKALLGNFSRRQIKT